MIMMPQGKADGVASVSVDCKDKDVTQVVPISADQEAIPETMDGSENASIPPSEKNDDETTQQTELSLASTPSKDSRVKDTQPTTMDDVPASVGSDSSSYTEITGLKDEHDRCRSSVTSDDLTLSNQSYIMDLTSQKQRRDKERHEEAFEEALERMKREHSKLDIDSNEYAILFLKTLAQVKAQLKETYREHDRLQDKRLDEAVRDETSRRRKDLLPTKPTRMESVSSVELLKDCFHVMTTNDISPTHPQRKESTTSVNLLQGAKHDCNNDVEPPKPARMESDHSSNLLLVNEQDCSKDRMPSCPQRMESRPSSRLHDNKQDNSNDLAPTKPARMESQPSSTLLSTLQDINNKGTASPSKAEQNESQISHTVSNLPDHETREAACLQIQTSYRCYHSRKACLETVKSIRMNQAATQLQSQWHRYRARLLYLRTLEDYCARNEADGDTIDAVRPPSKEDPCTTNSNIKRNLASKKVRLKRTEKPLRYKSLEVPSHSASPKFGTKREAKTNDERHPERKDANTEKTKGDATRDEKARSTVKVPPEKLQQTQQNSVDCRATKGRIKTVETSPKRRRKTIQAKVEPSRTSASSNLKQSIASHFSGKLQKKFGIASIVQSSRETCQKAIPFLMPLRGKPQENGNSPTTNSRARKRSSSREKKRSLSKDSSRSKRKERSRSKSKERSRSKSKERSRSKSKGRPRKDVVEKSRGKSRERNRADTQTINPDLGTDIEKDVLPSKKIVVKRVIRNKSEQAENA